MSSKNPNISHLSPSPLQLLSVNGVKPKNDTFKPTASARAKAERDRVKKEEEEREKLKEMTMKNERESEEKDKETKNKNKNSSHRHMEDIDNNSQNDNESEYQSDNSPLLPKKPIQKTSSITKTKAISASISSSTSTSTVNSNSGVPPASASSSKDNLLPLSFHIYRSPSPSSLTLTHSTLHVYVSPSSRLNKCFKQISAKKNFSLDDVVFMWKEKELKLDTIPYTIGIGSNDIIECIPKGKEHLVDRNYDKDKDSEKEKETTKRKKETQNNPSSSSFSSSSSSLSSSLPPPVKRPLISELSDDDDDVVETAKPYRSSAAPYSSASSSSFLSSSASSSNDIAKRIKVEGKSQSNSLSVSTSAVPAPSPLPSHSLSSSSSSSSSIYSFPSPFSSSSTNSLSSLSSRCTFPPFSSPSSSSPWLRFTIGKIPLSLGLSIPSSDHTHKQKEWDLYSFLTKVFYHVDNDPSSCGPFEREVHRVLEDIGAEGSTVMSYFPFRITGNIVKISTKPKNGYHSYDGTFEMECVVDPSPPGHNMGLSSSSSSSPPHHSFFLTRFPFLPRLFSLCEYSPLLHIDIKSFPIPDSVSFTPQFLLSRAISYKFDLSTHLANIWICRENQTDGTPLLHENPTIIGLRRLTVPLLRNCKSEEEFHDKFTSSYVSQLCHLSDSIELKDFQVESICWMIGRESVPMEERFYYPVEILNDCPNKLSNINRGFYSPFFGCFKKELSSIYGGFLSHEMGLGKSIMALAMIHLNKSLIPTELMGKPIPNMFTTRIEKDKEKKTNNNKSNPNENNIMNHHVSNNVLMGNSDNDVSMMDASGNVIPHSSSHSSSSSPSPSPPPSLPLRVPEEKKDPLIASRCTLIISPPSVAAQWVSELTHKSHLSHRLRVIPFYGSTRTRDLLAIVSSDAVVTTYGILHSEYYRKNSRFSSIYWHRIICDESHYTKNDKSKIAVIVSKLKSDRRWMLSGTPLSQSWGLRDLVGQMKSLAVESFSAPSIVSLMNENQQGRNAMGFVQQKPKDWKMIREQRALFPSETSSDSETVGGMISSFVSASNLMSVMGNIRSLFSSSSSSPSSPSSPSSSSSSSSLSPPPVPYDSLPSTVSRFNQFIYLFFTNCVIRHTHRQSYNNRATLLVLPPRHSSVVQLPFSMDQQAIYDRLYLIVKSQFDLYSSVGLTVSKTIEVLSLINPLRLLCSGGYLNVEEMERKLKEKKESIERIVKEITERRAAEAKQREEKEQSRLIQMMALLEQKMNDFNAAAASAAKSSSSSLANAPLSSILPLNGLDECVICLDSIDDPMITPCRHVFCSACIVEIVSGPPGGRKCPLDRNPLAKKDLQRYRPPDPEEDELEKEEEKEREMAAKAEEKNQKNNVLEEEHKSENDNDAMVDSDHHHINAHHVPMEDDGNLSMSIHVESSVPIIPTAPSYFGTKFDSLLSHLRRIPAGQKSLVFTQFASTMKYLEEYLPLNNIPTLSITGNLSVSARRRRMEEFISSPTHNVFLLSVRAAAVGITLTAANHVFIMEPALNPSLIAQAIGRVCRISQNRPVYIYHFQMKNSIEQRIYELHEERLKRSLEQFAAPEGENERGSGSENGNGEEGAASGQGEVLGALQRDGAESVKSMDLAFLFTR